MSIQQISSPAQLSLLLSKTSYTVVDFYADWCPPCKAIAPLFASLADKHSRPGSLAFAKVNVDHNPSVAQRYGVTAMPTFLVMRGADVASDEAPLIRGADPRRLTATVESVARLARDAEETRRRREEEEEEEEEMKKEEGGDDGTTVSGGYTLGVDGGKRQDWKMSLN